MKGRPVYSILFCLLGNRTASWLVTLVVIAITISFLNGYIMYTVQSRNGVETTEQNGMGTHHASGPTVWIYHDTVC